MATLANVNGASLVADTGGLNNMLLQTFGTKQQRDTTAQNKADLQTNIDLVTTGDTKQREAALLRISAINPQIANSMKGIIESGDKTAMEQAAVEAEKGVKEAVLVKSLKTPAAKRNYLIGEAQKKAAQGKNIDRYIELIDMSPESLDIELEKMIITGADVKTLAKESLGGRTGSFSKSPGVIIKQEDGSFAQSIPILNQQTGQIENKIVPIDGSPVSRLGESADEQTAREIFEAGATKKAEQGAVLQTASSIESEKKKGSETQGRIQTTINEGLDASKGASILHRSIALLDSVETGGFDKAALKAKQLFGVESADEAELSANLGKSVLSQLRTVFGAAFTEREGSRLDSIEANFGKSTEGNKRLLKQTLALVDRAAKRGIKAAVSQEDYSTAAEIQELLDSRLTGDPAGTAQNEGQPLPNGVTEEDIAETMRANNMTREQVLERLNGGG